MGTRKEPTEGHDNDEDYDPHLYRDVPKPTTNCQTLAHILKACIGTGILAMPEAFKHSGMYLGMVSTALIGFLCAYCLHVLVKSQYMLCKKLKVPLLRYPESMQAAFQLGPECLRGASGLAFNVTNVVLIIYQTGLCCVYYVFISINLQDLIDPHLSEPLGITMYMVYLFIPFCLILTIRNLRMLAPFSIFANIITFATFGVVCFYVFQNLPNFFDVPNEATPKTYALFCGTALFAIQSIGVVTSAENNMATPKSFLRPFGVLNIAMIIITSIYVFMGMMGYWRYCLEGIESSITLNLPHERVTELYKQGFVLEREIVAVVPIKPYFYSTARVIIILYTIAIYISSGLQGYVAVFITWNGCVEKHVQECSEKRKIVYEYLMRFAVALISCDELKMKIVTVDIQGFQLSDGFTAKEIAIYNGSQTSHYIIKSAKDFCTLSPDDKAQVRWLERNCHGLKYSSGYINYVQVDAVILEHLGDVDVVYVRGHQKYDFIITKLSDVKVVNMEKLDCDGWMDTPKFESKPPHCMNHSGVGTAVTIPMLGLIISLVGSFGLSLLGFIFPAIMETCAHWPDDLGPKKWILWKDIFIIIIGLLGLCCGSYACISEIVMQSKDMIPSVG